MTEEYLLDHYITMRMYLNTTKLVHLKKVFINENFQLVALISHLFSLYNMLFK